MDLNDRYVEVTAPLSRLRREVRGLFLPAIRRPSIEIDDDWSPEYGGMKVRVRYVMDGKGTAVVLVHGLGASLAVWGENVGPLAQRHSVYALDLPGNGKSDKPDEMAYDAVSGAHILAKFIDTLGIGSATLVGNSQVDPIIRTAVRLK